MTHRLTVEWPDPGPFRDRCGAPLRILALSDVLEPTLIDARNREALKPVDLIVGCGDLGFDDLGFVADGLDAPLVYVRGNHDTAQSWSRSSGSCPTPPPSTFIARRGGIAIGGLSWPGKYSEESQRNDFGAWRQAISLAIHRLRRTEPLMVISHVPPAGVGDVPTDGYHRGFSGYAWLLRRLGPTLWLHGHTPLASTREWHVNVGGTEVVNVTGAVLIELVPPGRQPRTPKHEPTAEPTAAPAAESEDAPVAASSPGSKD